MHNLELLKHWNTAGQQMEQAFAKYEDVTHTPSDASHLDRARNAMHRYTVLVAKTTGIPFDALYDWWTACEFGRTDLVVRKGSGDFQSLRSIEQVYEFYSALDRTEWPDESKIDAIGQDGEVYPEYTLEEVIGDADLDDWVRWVAIDESGGVWVYSHKPVLGEYGVWQPASHLDVRLKKLKTIAPSKDYRNCLWEIKK